jgi:murein DD-endopeptidase MepM/ murein hydrolase activator NlpD
LENVGENMNRSFKVLAVVLLAATVNTNVFADDLINTKDNLNTIKESIDKNKDKIKAIDTEKDNAEKQLKVIESELNNISIGLEKINNEISTVNEDIDRLNLDIEEKEKSVEDGQELLGLRIGAMYKTGLNGYLSLIFNSKNLSEVFERVTYIARIIKYDNEMIEKIQEEKKYIEIQRTEMKEKKEELVNLEEKSEFQQAKLEKQSDEKITVIKNLEKDKGKYEELVKEEEAESRELQQKIIGLQAQQKQRNNKVVTRGNQAKPSENQPKPTESKTVSITGSPYRITSPYGWRVHPVLGYRRFHKGIDIGVPMGTPLYSMRDGVVIFSGTMNGYGRVIMVDHGSLVTLYAHNSSLVKREGQIVKGGQLIAYSGNSGLSTGPHLHFEVRNSSGETMDPAPYYK